jgi:hypothetical protein
VLTKNGYVLRGIPEEEGAIRFEITRDEWQRGKGSLQSAR